MTSLALSSTGKKPVSLDFIPGEGIDQLLCFPGEPRDHPNAQGFGVWKEAAVEAAAQEHLHASGREVITAAVLAYEVFGRLFDQYNPVAGPG